MAEKDKEFVLKTVKDKKVKFVRLWFTDVLGFLKSFAITAEELEKALDEGMGFDGSSIEGYARIEESDMIAKPDPGTFVILPWRPDEGAGVARMFCDVLKPDGTHYEADPRWVLKRNLKKAADLGYTFYVGPELEYFYFKSWEGTPATLDAGGYFDLTPLDVASDMRRDTVLTLEKMGIDVEYSHHEVAPSQHEIDLRYMDALAMADAAMTYRLTVKEVAMKHGVYATFMPKPIFAQNGSGMHTHQSLFKGDENVFFDESDEYNLSATGKAYIAGLLPCPRDGRGCRTMGELVQEARAGVRGPRVHLVGASQPVDAGARADVQARESKSHPRRVPVSRPRVQPVPGVLGHAGRWAQRYRGRVRASRTG